MSFKPFKQIKVPPNSEITEKQINAVQSNIAEALAQILGKDQLDSKILQNIQLNPGVINKVAHGLNRNLNGWIVIRNHGGYSLLTDMQDNNQSPHLLLYLTTPVFVMVDLLVF